MKFKVYRSKDSSGVLWPEEGHYYAHMFEEAARGSISIRSVGPHEDFLVVRNMEAEDSGLCIFRVVPETTYSVERVS